MKLSQRFIGRVPCLTSPVQRNGGFTLVEAMAAVVILSLSLLGLLGALGSITRGVQANKGRTLAMNLAQEKIDVLKNRDYARVLVSDPSSPGSVATDPALGITYETPASPLNPPETMTVGGLLFERRTFVERVVEDPATRSILPAAASGPDTGVKQVTVSVVWTDDGGQAKFVQLRNILQDIGRDTMDATVSGRVSGAGPTGAVPLVNAKVVALEDPTRLGAAGAGGNYAFKLAGGTYTLRATFPGYFPQTMVVTTQRLHTVPNMNFTLTKMSTVKVTGHAFFNDHLVISQVGVDDNGVEYVEIYNPTAADWDMAAAPLSLLFEHKGVSSASRQRRRKRGGNPTGPSVQVSAVPSFLPGTSVFPSNAYRLLAAGPAVQVAGVSVAADGVFSCGGACFSQHPGPGGWTDAAVNLLDNGAPPNEYDSVAWDNTFGEGTMLRAPGGNGLTAGNVFVRASVPGAYNPGEGNAFDSDDNAGDFFRKAGAARPAPRDRASSLEAPLSGAPAAGGVVRVTDGLSAPAAVGNTGAFTVTNVATGTWQVIISSGLLTRTTGYYGEFVQGRSTDTGKVLLNQPVQFGYISGVILDTARRGIPNIEVQANGFPSSYTDLNGAYTCLSAPGVVTVTANPNQADPTYVQSSIPGVAIALGQSVTGVDFTLLSGGDVWGRVTASGGVINPMPGITVTAYQFGQAKASAVTDVNGDYRLQGLQAGTYDITPDVDTAVQTASPVFSPVTVPVPAGFNGQDFSVLNSVGQITGRMAKAGNPQRAIDSGVTLLAVDSAAGLGCGGAVPILSATTTAARVFYSGMSDGQGQYHLHVRKWNAMGVALSYTVLAWYTDPQKPGQTRCQQASNVTLAGAGAAVRNFNW